MLHYEQVFDKVFEEDRKLMSGSIDETSSQS